MSNITDRIGGRGGGGESEGEGDGEEKRVDGYVAGRAEGDICFPSSKSTSLTQGPRTMGTHQLLVISTLLFELVLVLFYDSSSNLILLSYLSSTCQSHSLSPLLFCPPLHPLCLTSHKCILSSIFLNLVIQYNCTRTDPCLSQLK